MDVRFERRLSWRSASICAVTALLLISACTGPDEFGGGAPSPSPTAEPSPTATEVPSTDATPEPEVTATPDLAPEPTPTEMDAVEVTPTEAVEPTPEPEPTPTEPPEPSPTPQPPSAMESLPQLEELSDGGYIVANDGDRTAEQLARAYTDSTAHLLRLEEWGFQQHVFREFTRNASGPDDPLPTYILTTVNVYGSPEQAEDALRWLERLQLNLGATGAEAPEIGEDIVALVVPTAQGEPTASVYVRIGPRIYVYYAQGNEPLPEVTAIATGVHQRLYGGD